MSSNAPVIQVRYRVRVTPALVWAIAAPYFGQRLLDQFKALAPIALFLFICQLIVLRQPVVGAAGVTAGLSCVVLGLMFFIEGLRLGVMPLGENIGATLPAKGSLAVIVAAACLLGTIATLAEPAVSTLAVLGGNVRYDGAPLLYDSTGNLGERDGMGSLEKREESARCRAAIAIAR